MGVAFLIASRLLVKSSARRSTVLALLLYRRECYAAHVSHSDSTLYLEAHGTRLPLGESPLRIGRHPACDLMIDDRLVSRHHATVRKVEPGWVLEDAGSRHGTWLDGERIQRPTLLRPGQRIRVGSVEIQVSSSQPESRKRRATAQGILRRKHRATDPPPRSPAAGFGLSDVSQVEAILLSGRRQLEEGHIEHLPPLLHALRSSIRGGLGNAPPPEPVLLALGDFALTVAERHGLVAWLDAWLQVLGVARRLPTSSQIDTLARLAQRGIRPGLEALEDALSRLYASVGSLSPSERNRLDRLASLHGGTVRRVVRLRPSSG